MKIAVIIPLLMGVTACYSQKNTKIPAPFREFPKDEMAVPADHKNIRNDNTNESAVTISPNTEDKIIGKQETASEVVYVNEKLADTKTGGIVLGHLSWEHFSGRYDIDIDLGGEQQYNGVMSFRMKRDSIFWFSISASIGFQIAKGIIKNDTLHALDLLQKNYYRISLKELQSSTQLPAQIGALQRLFSGETLSQLIYFNSADSTFRGDASFYPGYTVKFDPTNRVLQNAINDEVNSRYLWADYTDRLQVENPKYSVASQTSLFLKDALKTIRLDVRLKTSSFEPIPSYPFNVPNGYTLVETW
jgi:hypothetical protein